MQVSKFNFSNRLYEKVQYNAGAKMNRYRTFISLTAFSLVKVFY